MILNVVQHVKKCKMKTERYLNRHLIKHDALHSFLRHLDSQRNNT